MLSGFVKYSAQFVKTSGHMLANAEQHFPNEMSHGLSSIHSRDLQDTIDSGLSRLREERSRLGLEGAKEVFAVHAKVSDGSQALRSASHFTNPDSAKDILKNGIAGDSLYAFEGNVEDVLKTCPESRNYDRGAVVRITCPGQALMPRRFVPNFTGHLPLDVNELTGRECVLDAFILESGKVVGVIGKGPVKQSDKVMPYKSSNPEFYREPFDLF